MQNGSLIRAQRKCGPDVWQFRWSEKGPEGKRIYRKRVIGTLDECANEKAARALLVGLVAELNPTNPLEMLPMTVGQLCKHFEQRELAIGNTWRSYATKKGYAVYINRWILPHWAMYELRRIRTIEVEDWLQSLPLAKSSRTKLRNIMSVLFNHAERYNFFDRNPIRLVRQSAKRRSPPVVLNPLEIRLLIDNLELRERTLVLLAASTGLRQSEMFGLQWKDVKMSEGVLHVTRSVVYGVVGPCKTEASHKPVPMHPLLREALGLWIKEQPFNKQEDWIFASARHRGRKPCWGHMILRKYIQPACLRLGIHKRIGWHTFRHTYSTLLASVGAEFKVMQELLRHSTLRSTMDVYTQAIVPAKFAAQAAVDSLVFPPKAEAQ